MSRRTDVPAFYGDWFWNRLRAGFVQSVNPYNRNQRRLVELGPEAVDGFVFWSKNPAMFLGDLAPLAPYAWYLQCTVTPYGPELEPGVPPAEAVMEMLEGLAGRVGRERLVWRYDPVLLAGEMTPEWHAERFGRMARRLAGVVSGCVFSFYDRYAGAEKRLHGLAFADDQPARLQTAALLAGQAQAVGLPLYTCAEARDYSGLGIRRSACIDAGRLSLLAGRALEAAKDPNQRPGCGCVRSIDIGSYDTCPAGCLYCYANRGGRESAANRLARQDPEGIALG